MTFLWLDWVELQIETDDIGSFLQKAAQKGCKIFCLKEENKIYTAKMTGTSLMKLNKMQNVKITVLRRRGMGRLPEKIFQRMGLVVGFAIFVVLVRLLSGILWCVDFGNLDETQQNILRQAMEEQGIREGELLTKEKLLAIQNSLAENAEKFAWVSLNFVNGRLFFENTDTQQETIKLPAEGKGLVAAENGKITAIRLQSGYAVVSAGQYVKKGQEIAVNHKDNHSGEWVYQAVEGEILAEIEKTYTFEQPMSEQKTILTGQNSKEEKLYFLGFACHWGTEEQFADGQAVESWIPLRLSGIAFPAVLYKKTVWEQTDAEISYSVETAQALALRQCYLQFAAEYPDAEILEQEKSAERRQNSVKGEILYKFQANIAKDKAKIDESS